jgi:hypothetical protein
MRSRIYARLNPRKTTTQKVALAVGSAKAQATEIGDRFGPVVVDARDRIAPVVTPVVTASRDRLGPVVEDARDRMAPVVSDARVRLADLAENVAVKLDADRAEPVVIEVEEKRRGGFRRFVAYAGLGVGAAYAAKRLRGSSSPRWNSDTPSDLAKPGTEPGTEPAPTVPMPTAAVTGMVASDRVDLEVPGADQAGGNPEEAASDAVETPHAVTTPDQPAQRVILD